MSRHYLYIIILTISLTHCGQKDATDGGVAASESSDGGDFFGSKKEDRMFKSIAAVVENKNICVWGDPKGSCCDCFLSFSSQYPGMLIFGGEYFLVRFPFKYDKTKITVYWDTLLKGDKEQVFIKRIKLADRKYFGHPFMILELTNDTTLKASYLFPELMETLNLADTNCNFFSKQFTSGIIEM